MPKAVSMRDLVAALQGHVENLGLPILLILGVVVVVALYAGKSMKWLRLPSLIGFMLAGVLAGPSLLNLLDDQMQQNLGFITEIALGFVALTIGFELSFKSLKKQGAPVIVIIFAESLFGFAAVTAAVYAFTGDLPLSLLLGAIAPASAPAGTVAVIQEYRARGPVTNALYSVVGFDDGLSIVIFGFASAIAAGVLGSQLGTSTVSTAEMLLTPVLEIGLSVGIGLALSVVYCMLVNRLSQGRDVFTLTVAVVLVSAGLSELLGLSLVLTNMTMGIYAVNTQHPNVIKRIGDEITSVMPLLFVFFFVLAGASLHVDRLPAMGLVGVIYILSRSAGKMSGAFLGAIVTNAERMIKRYLGLGVLSQAGVSIGLALIVASEFSHFGEPGQEIARTVITVITATSIIFEIIGPILTRIALKKAGEIPDDA